MRSIIEHSLNALSVMAEQKELTFQLSCPADEFILAYTVLISQVFNNLLKTQSGIRMP